MPSPGTIPVPAICARCGKEATGFAMIADERFCHGDDERPSCYEKQNWDRAQEGLQRWLSDVDGWEPA